MLKLNPKKGKSKTQTNKIRWDGMILKFYLMCKK